VRAPSVPGAAQPGTQQALHCADQRHLEGCPRGGAMPSTGLAVRAPIARADGRRLAGRR
jgi:hypothetical protein